MIIIYSRFSRRIPKKLLDIGDRDVSEILNRNIYKKEISEKIAKNSKQIANNMDKAKKSIKLFEIIEKDPETGRLDAHESNV